MPSRIVTTHYRYKRPPRKRKAVPLEGPAIVRTRRVGAVDRHDGSEVQAAGATAPAAAPAEDDRKPVIVTARRPGARSVEVPDMTPEEHRRRGDAATELWRELVRRAGKD